MFEPVTLCTGFAHRVKFTFDGRPISAMTGMTVAAALLAADQRWFRKTAVSGQLRGPFCMMGACYDCLVLIDGVSVQACMTQVSDGLNVHSVPELFAEEGQVT